jgi:hypothetical protein
VRRPGQLVGRAVSLGDEQLGDRWFGQAGERDVA